MTLVADASVVVAALVDSGPQGVWAERMLAGDDTAAPHFMPVEVAILLRRAVLAGKIGDDTAALAHADLVALPVELFPYAPLSGRVWELRRSVTAYDAWYVALAEALGARLATLDVKLSRATGPRCRFALPG